MNKLLSRYHGPLFYRRWLLLQYLHNSKFHTCEQKNREVHSLADDRHRLNVQASCGLKGHVLTAVLVEISICSLSTGWSFSYKQSISLTHHSLNLTTLLIVKVVKKESEVESAIGIVHNHLYVWTCCSCTPNKSTFHELRPLSSRQCDIGRYVLPELPPAQICARFLIFFRIFVSSNTVLNQETPAREMSISLDLKTYFIIEYI